MEIRRASNHFMRRTNTVISEPPPNSSIDYVNVTTPRMIKGLNLQRTVPTFTKARKNSSAIFCCETKCFCILPLKCDSHM